MHMSTNTTTKTDIHLSPLAWKHWSMTNPTNATPTLNTASKLVLGTSTEHYRCWKFWIPTTRATRISGAAFFKHKYLTNPSLTPEDQVIATAARLMDALQGIRSPQLQTSTLKSLSDIQDIFHKAANTTQDLSPTQSLRTPPRVTPTSTPGNNVHNVKDTCNITHNDQNTRNFNDARDITRNVHNAHNLRL
jgi:hypothetical protein